jgi:hypothetical protein
MHRQHFSGFFRSAIGTFSPQHSTLEDNKSPMKELAMETIARICFPLLHRWKWPKVNIVGLARPFGDAVEVYRGALSAAYVTALFFDQRNECPPDDNLDGRDPRW